jgi:hypothetical protein
MNRATYVQPYSLPRYAPARRVETHELIARSPREREAGQTGHGMVEEHRRK